jgi:uncharacterized protein YfeS
MENEYYSSRGDHIPWHNNDGMDQMEEVRELLAKQSDMVG